MLGRRTLLCVAGLAMASGCFEHPKIAGERLECLDDDGCLPGYVCTRKATDPGEVWGHCVLPDASGFESGDASKGEAGAREASVALDGTSGIDLRATADRGGGLDSVADGPDTSILPDGSALDDAEGAVDGSRSDDGATDGPGPATGGTSGSGGAGGSGGVRGTEDTGRDAGADTVSGGATGVFDGGHGGGGAVAGTTGSAGASTAGGTSSGGATTNSGGATASGGGGAGGTTTTVGSSGGASSSSSSSGPPPHLVPSTNDPVPLGEVATGESSSVASFTLTNTGPPTTGGVNVASTSSEFVIQTGGTGDCASDAQLGTNQSCTVRMVLSPTTSGSKSALITFSTTPGNNGTVSLTGTATQGARLSTSLTTLTFDGIAVSSTSPASTITVTNTGLRPTGKITVTPSGSDFTLLTNATDDCHSGTTVLAAGASCNLRLTFTPAAMTGSTGSISVSATPGGTAGVSLLGCASDAHNGGDGTCVAKSMCSSGYHNSGTGHCVVNAPCPTDQLTNDAGTCVPMAGVNWVNRSFSGSWARVVSSADGLHLAVLGQVQEGSLTTNRLYVSNGSADSWQKVTANYLVGPTWRTVTMSADGSTLNAWAWDYPTLYSNGSTDFGATWTAGDYSSYSIPIKCTASSADGARLALGGDMEAGIMTSPDFGANWETQALSPGYVTALAMSADGTKLVAGTQTGALAISLDGGVNWTNLTSPTTQRWVSLASSSDVTKLVGVADKIYISSDSGGHWTPKEQTRTWSAVASSGDGAKLIASVNSGYLYLSSDSGGTWVPRGPSMTWASVASSVDGTRLVAVGGAAGDTTGFVYTSSGPVP